MTRRWPKSPFALLFLVALISMRAQERPNLAVLGKIEHEAFHSSHVMETEFYLTEVYGPRITNSPGFFSAADWAQKQLNDWGIQAHQEKFPFGRGWAYTHYSASMIQPQYAPLIGFPEAWTAGTNGTVTGEPILLGQPTSEADLDQFKGRIKGKIVLIGAPVHMEMQTEPRGLRLTSSQLADISQAPDPSKRGLLFANSPILMGGPLFTGSVSPDGKPGPTEQNIFKNIYFQGAVGGHIPPSFRPQLWKFLAEEQPLVVVEPGAGISGGGTVFGQQGGSFHSGDPIPPPTVVLTPEQYNRIVRLVEHKILVKLEFNIQTKFYTDRIDSVNVIGEIEGGKKKDEVVMVGAHLDSWQGGTGATDDAANCAVMMEALRILKILNLPMDRTVRIALWGAEEQGSPGSKTYVKTHFGDPATMHLKPEAARLSVYFNLDEGSGRIRGIFDEGNETAGRIFTSWFAPVSDLTDGGIVSNRSTGGNEDHMSFNAVGLPGFQFIQDPLEYYSFTHHSNMDVYDHVQKGDLMQMSAIMAWFIYNAATRDEMMPRVPLPAPETQHSGMPGGAPRN